MEVPLMQFPPGDPRVVDKIASQLKSQGIFDQFRKECISDVDTKPAYQNLHQRVEGTVASFLASQEWRPDLNKNQLRDSLRKHIHESGFLDIGVERIVDQVVNPKIMTVFLPQIEDVVYKCLGLEKPKKGKDTQTGFAKQPSANVPQKIVTLKDLLPTDLDPISPESDGIKDKDEMSEDEKEFESANNEEEEEEEKAADEEEVSPPFEPIEEVNSQCDESSVDSRLSGISNLTSHDSQTSNASFGGNVQITNAKIPVIDLANHDSQLSKVSSGSRLSIVFSDDQEKLALKPPSSPPEIDIVNDESQLSKSSLQILSQESQASDNIEMSNQGSEESKATECIIGKDSSSDTSNVDTKSSSKSPNIILCENDHSKGTCLDDAGDTNSSKTDSEEKSVETEKVEKKYINEKEDREKLLDPRDEKKRSRTGSESGDLKKNEHERKRSDKYRRDRGESKRSSRHDDKDRSDEKSKRDGGKGKESEKDNKKDRIRTDAKIEKDKMKLEERDEIRDKPKYADRSENSVHKNKTKNDVDSEKDESAELGDKFSQDYEDDFEKNGDKVKLDDLFGEDELKHDDNLEKEGNRKEDKSRHRSKYEDKKERERNKERESGKSKGRHDDRLSKDGSKEKSHNEDKFDRDSAKDREDKIKSDKDRIEKEGKERSRHESRSERDFNKEKSKHEEKIDKEGSKDKQKTEDKIDKSRQDRSKHSDKGEKDSNRDRTKHDAKQEKERRSDDRSKASFDKLSKEKKEDASKADEVDGDKREKSRSEVRKDKTGREKSKHEDRGRSKTDSKHKESTKAEVKEDGSSRNEKSNRDRSGNRDSKSKSKSEGKENDNRREEKGTKDRTKTDERNGRDKSSKSQSKGKENHEKKLDRKRDDSDSGKSSRSGDNKGKDAKKKEGKSKSVVDDHHIHRDKNNTDDRRSTDRDSSGTQRSRTVSSRRSGSDTRSSHRHDKRDSNGSSGNNKSDGGGNSESAAELPEDSSDQASMEMPVSPPASLPFKKRPVQNQTADTDSREEYSCTMNAGKLILKSKKPKIAANIFEARKIMHLRKSMAKYERKKQKRWRKDQSDKRNAERRSDSDQENDIPPDSLSLNVTSKKEGSESDEEPLLFFSEEEARVDEDFIQFVKKLEESETLSQISWESSSESDHEIQPHSENNVAVNVVDNKEGMQDDGVPNMNNCKFIESKDELSVIGNYSCDNTNEALPETDEPFLNNTSVIINSEDTLPATNESLFSNSSDDVKSTHNRRSRIKYEFSENINRRVLSRRTSKAPEREGEINETALAVINTKVVQDIGGIVQNSSSRGVRTNNGNSESSVSEGEPVCNQSPDKFDDIHSDYTVSNNDVIDVPHETSRAPNLDYAISVDSTDDDDNGDDDDDDDDDDDNDDSDSESVHKNTVHINDLDVDRNDYSYIGDNNNVDKSSSDDEKCGDGMSLSKELILPALRDLILESGFQLGDDLESTECLAAGSGMPTPDSQGEMSEKQSSAGSGSSASNASEKKRLKLGRSRRVGLGKPHPSKRLDVGKRVATPPAVAADFVMPLSPESDVSASSMEQIRKGPADVQADASSLSEVAETTNFAHLDNDSEERRHLRSSSAGIPGRHDQVNNNEDLFKPRPLFSQRKHGQFSSTQVEEPVVNCVGKRRRSTIESDGPQTSKRMRR